MFFLMREALRLATVDFLLSEVALVTVECASVMVNMLTSTTCGCDRSLKGKKKIGRRRAMDGWNMLAVDRRV